jgi:hypothetical protein
MKYLYVLIMILSLESCEDFFRTTIKVNPPEHTDGLVVHLYINDSSDTIKASVSKSIGALETVKDRTDLLINDAVVQIKNENDEVVFELNNIEPKKGSMINFVLPLSTPFSGNGKTYKLQLMQSALGTATAVQTMPEPVLITNPEFKLNSGHDLDGYPVSTLSFDLHDPTGEVNYYQIKVLYVNKAQGVSYYYSLSSYDPVYVSSYDYNALMLSDKTFNGKKFHVKLDTYINELDSQGELYIDIKGISKDFYLFSKSMYMSYNQEDMGFTEPVSVYNNINNGLGIFSLSSRKLYEAELKGP